MIISKKVDDYIENKKYLENINNTIVPDISIAELRKTIIELNSKTSQDIDNISNRMLKNLDTKIENYLLILFNKCLANASLPVSWKRALVTMIPKKSSSKDPKDYRPISMTSCIVRLLERIIANRLTAFLKDKKILIKNQSGFREKRQTKDNLFGISQNVLEGFNRGKKTCAIFYDIAGAFDKVWHNGLIYKLIEYKIPIYIIEWIVDYLRNRTFSVKIGDSLSPNGRIDCGVPQGGVLSPLLFSIYINSVPVDNYSSYNIKHRSFLFADDLADIFTFKTIGNQIESRINDRLKELESWLNKWRLKIAPHKCNYVIFSQNFKSGYNEKMNLMIYNNNINQDENNNLKFLGIRFDKHFTMKHQIKYLKETTSERLNIIKILSHKSWNLSTKTLVNIYKALIRSILDYSLFLYNILPKSTQIRLQSIQNSALRVIYKPALFTNSNILHKHANISPLEERAKSLNEKYIREAIVNNNELILDLIEDYNKNKTSLNSNRKKTLLDCIMVLNQ